MEEYQAQATAHDDAEGTTRDAGKQRFTVKVALDGVDFKTIELDDPVPLGRQILAAAKLKPAGDYQLYAILESGDFEDVRLDEPFDLRAKGVERFIAFSADKVFRFTIDDREIKWGLEGISEHALRYLGQVDEDHAVFLEVRGGTDRLIEDGETVDLTGGGVERFITAKRPITYAFFVNGKKYETEHRKLTGKQIKAMVAGWDPTHDLVLEGHGDDPDRVIGDDEAVDLKTEHGHRRFSSVPKANFG